MQIGFLVDQSKCVGCKACEIACKNRNQLGVGPRLREVIQVESGTYPDVTVMNLSMACMHCGKPACMAVCPAGAITKRSEDGVVLVDQKKCIGCRYCFFACPFGVPQYRQDGTMIKCDFCQEFLAIGKDPACVATCMYDALHYGTLAELTEMARQKTATNLAQATQPSMIVVK